MQEGFPATEHPPVPTGISAVEVSAVAAAEAGALDAPRSRASDDPRSPDVPRSLDDPRALQILSTEHWSLLATRSLSYNESFARAGMFLTFLGASLVAIGLIAGATGFTGQLALVAAVILATDLFVGVATLGRIMDASAEEMSCVAGMNRIRHAYLEMVPGIEPYFSTPFHDDPLSILATYGAPGRASSPLRDLAHGLTTAPAMVGVVVAVVFGALVGTIALGVGSSSGVAFVAGSAGFVVAFGLVSWYGWSSALAFMDSRSTRFPRPLE